MKGKFKELYERARKHDAYWLEGPVLDFTHDLLRTMARQGVSKSDLARRLGTSPAYVTKILRGNANFTLLSMVKLARALNSEVRVHVAEDGTITRWQDQPTWALHTGAPMGLKSNRLVFANPSSKERAWQDPTLRKVVGEEAEGRDGTTAAA